MIGPKEEIRLMLLIQGLSMGGLEKMVADLANHLPSHYKICLCCYDGLGSLTRIISQRIKIILLKRKPGIDIPFVFRIRRLMRKEKINIFHAHNNTAFFYGTIAAKLAGVKKIVYTEHGRTYKLSKPALLAQKILSGFIEKAVVVTEGLKEILVNEEGFRSNKVCYIPNGVDGSPYMDKTRRFDLRSELGINASQRLIGIVARLDPVKNHRLLLQAMKEVLAEEPLCRLLIVGDGPLGDELKQEASDLKLKDRVLFLGERNDIARIFSGLDVFVLCSLSEGMSLTLVEAMAAGLPIVATRVGGNPTLISSEASGLLVPSNDSSALARAILRILTNEVLAKSLGAGARKSYLENYTLERMIARYREVYES